jgi:TolB-like protein/AraC-like DNA-binding protein
MESANVVLGTFLGKLRKAVDANLTNDQFGVEELARQMGMSRSQLHRKLTTTTGQSVSQFIREYRLERGMELLKQGDLTAVEVADKVGFGSATYFNTCFNEYFGFTPGEVKHKAIELSNHSQEDAIAEDSVTVRPKKQALPVLTAIVVITTVIGFIYFNYARKPFVTGNDKSIAILPFKNLSTDKRTEYFTEGVIEAIRTNLSRVSELRVIARTSVEQYRATSKPAREIAKELGVAALLEGSVQRDNNQVRIDVRLIDGKTETQVWAKSYNRELADVFAIQSEIAQYVVNELNAEISPEEKSKLSETDTRDSKAYDLYLKAIYEYRTYSNQGAHNSIDLLTEAIALDPNYARAYAFLANSYIGLAAIWSAELSALDALEKGKPFLDKALQLEPTLDEAHMLMGFYKLYHDWDIKGAESHYKMGIVNDHPDALALYVDYLNFVSRHEEAMMYAERLNEKDPYYPNSRINLAYIYNNRMEEALEFSTSRVKMFNNYYTLDAHGFLLLNMKRYKESIEYFQKAISLEGIRYPRMLGWMGAAYAKDGDRASAMKIVKELKDRLANNDQGSVAFFIAAIYSALNEKEAALQWLKKSYQSHDMEMPWLMTEPQFYPLHNEPEFVEIANAMGFLDR